MNSELRIMNGGWCCVGNKYLFFFEVENEMLCADWE